ncbi:unnamed protein product [Urochloa humidicola]
MDAMEEILRFTLLVGVLGRCSALLVEAMCCATLDLPSVDDDRLSARHFALESFMVVFASQRARGAAMATGSGAGEGGPSFSPPMDTARACRL